MVNKVKVISEIGINHNGSMELCKELIMLSKVAGADYAKIQNNINMQTYHESIQNA